MQPLDVGDVAQVLDEAVEVGRYGAAFAGATAEEGNGLGVRPQAGVNVPAQMQGMDNGYFCLTGNVLRQASMPPGSRELCQHLQNAYQSEHCTYPASL